MQIGAANKAAAHQYRIRREARLRIGKCFLRADAIAAY
jgi:hypothetical protein